MPSCPLRGSSFNPRGVSRNLVVMITKDGFTLTTSATVSSSKRFFHQALRSTVAIYPYEPPHDLNTTMLL